MTHIMFADDLENLAVAAPVKSVSRVRGQRVVDYAPLPSTLSCRMHTYKRALVELERLSQLDQLRNLVVVAVALDLGVECCFLPEHFPRTLIGGPA